MNYKDKYPTFEQSKIIFDLFTTELSPYSDKVYVALKEKDGSFTNIRIYNSSIVEDVTPRNNYLEIPVYDVAELGEMIIDLGCTLMPSPTFDKQWITPSKLSAETEAELRRTTWLFFDSEAKARAELLINLLKNYTK